MRRKISSETYVTQKNEILDNCLHLTEEIYSILRNQEDPALLLQERMSVINELVTLESSIGDKILKTCSRADAKQMDDKLRLILSLDKQIEESILDAQSKILESMKHNIQEQRFTLFETGIAPESGRYLDEKQ